jgi:hypothetical protein
MEATFSKSFFRSGTAISLIGFAASSGACKGEAPSIIWGAPPLFHRVSTPHVAAGQRDSGTAGQCPHVHVLLTC